MVFFHAAGCQGNGIAEHFKITNLKSQYQMTETGLVRRRRIGHSDLFEVCYLLFGIFRHFIAQRPLSIFTGNAIEKWKR